MASMNISYYTIPVAWLIAFAPKYYSVKYYNDHAKKGRWDASNPRETMAALSEDAKMDEAVRQVVTRANGAQLNGFENLGFYAAAIVAANTAGSTPGFLNFWSIWYLLTRCMYNVAYVKGVTKARGFFYMLSMFSIFGCFIEAGNLIRRGEAY